MSLLGIGFDWPPPLLAVAIAAGGAIPLLLVALRFGPASLRPPGARFKISVAAGFSVLLLGSLSLCTRGTPVDLLDGLAALSIVGAAAILAFIAWSLVVWGFTIIMLLCLAEDERAVDLGGWAERHAGKDGIGRLASDRLSVLLAAGLASMADGGTCQITTRGRRVERGARILGSLFGMSARR